MPGPILFELCNSLQQSVHNFVNKYTKQNFEVPSQVLEIQGLEGQKPGEKWKYLNTIVNRIAENVKNGDELESHLNSFTPFLYNLIKTNVGVKLQLNNFIVESLKSEDVSINKKALKARWFFDGGNPRVSADYFAKDILPYVSVRTRLDIVKRLARGLRGYEAKAQQFFHEFVELYGVSENLSILLSCSEDFIFDSILRYKIVLPTKILNVLYSRRQRDLVVRYLQLCNEKNNDKHHEIIIHDYDVFLPKLIHHYPQDFVSLYALTPEKILPTLSARQTTWLLANAKDAIINRSDIFLKLLQPKVVKIKLSREDMETMLEHYMPNNVTDFRLDAALDFVNNYLEGNDGIQVLMRKFEKLYGTSLLDYARKLIVSSNKSAGLRLLRKLSATERERQIKILLANADRDVGLKDILMSYSNPSESLPYFKEKISKSSSADERMRFIDSMIVSCGVQNSKTDLLDVLKYFREKHMNERSMILYRFLESLESELDFNTLDDAHWSILRDIINNARIQKKLNNHVTLVEIVLEAMLGHAMTRKRRDERHVEEAIEIIVECKMENFSPNWNVFKDNLAMQKECLEQFFLKIPQKYPEDHSIWKDENDRIAVSLSLLKSIKSYNRISKKAKINLKDYPWIMKLSEEFICCPNTGFRKELIAKLIKQQAPDFYETKMASSSRIHDISNGYAIQLLKNQPEQILANWEKYLNNARDKLQSSNRAIFDKAREKLRARQFIAATKWHNQIPVKFIEACFSEIKTAGSLIILGILLPGESYEKIAASYTPKQSEKNDKESFEMTCGVLEGMKLTNPPVTLDHLQPYCHNAMYRQIADGALTSIASRVSVGSAVEFARKLTSQAQTSLIKRGVNLAKIVSTKQQFRELLNETWMKSNAADVSIRRLLSKMIFDNAFISSPHKNNSQLMLKCLRGLTPDDKAVLTDLNDIEKIDNETLSDYVEDYLNKVEEIFTASLDFEWRTKCVCLLVECFDAKLTSYLSEDVSSKILKKYFFDTDCVEISRAVRMFAVRYYLLACSDDKFASRLNVLVDILKKTTESFDVSHPKKRRYYPANYTLQEFFAGLLTELCATDNDKKLQIINSILEVFKMNLSPWQEPKSYIALNLYKQYLISTSPIDFGIRVAQQIGTLVEDFSSNEPIDDIADCLNDFIFGKVFRNCKNPYILKMSLTEGLLQGDEYYGALTSTKLLDSNEVIEYDERYDRLISTLRQMRNSSIQYNLYKHLNSLTDL